MNKDKHKHQDKKSGHTITVELPVVLEKANVVFDMNHLTFSGDVPVGINSMRLLADRFRDMDTKGRIIGVFHGDAAYLTLNDEAYNIFRKVITGNPYKGLLSGLLKKGVQLEECVVSMKNHAWGNDDLLPEVKVNAWGVGRIIQLVQEGYVQIQP